MSADRPDPEVDRDRDRETYARLPFRDSPELVRIGEPQPWNDQTQGFVDVAIDAGFAEPVVVSMAAEYARGLGFELIQAAGRADTKAAEFVDDRERPGDANAGGETGP